MKDPVCMRGYIKIETLEVSKVKAVIRIVEQTHRDFIWESKRHPGCILRSDCWPDLMIFNTNEKKFQLYLRGNRKNWDDKEIWMERWVYDILIDIIDEYNGVPEKNFLLDERLFEI